MIGQHTVEVCSELLALDDAAIAHLVEQGAIDPPPPS